ncbi:MAG: hypothetical protein LBE85_05920 [Candidatus Accumulibacter sp.]|jgi:hypothetical protein|nr:hypothetical protein [Accumulibacter sp.]
MKTGIVLSVLVVAMMSIPSKETFGQNFFKCKDQSGKIIFSDRACPSDQAGEKMDLPSVNSTDHSYYRQSARQAAMMEPDNGPSVISIGGDSSASRKRSEFCDKVRGSIDPKRGPTAAQLSVMASCAGVSVPSAPVPSAPRPRPNNPAAPAPSVITSCDNTGCWDNMGNRYAGAGGTYFHPQGRVCQRTGGVMICP